MPRIEDYIRSLEIAPDQDNREFVLERISNWLDSDRGAIEEYREKINSPKVSEELRKAFTDIIAYFDQVEEFYNKQRRCRGERILSIRFLV